MKKLYLDVCTLCRPFDNQNSMRVRLETDAYYLILHSIQSKKFELIVSPAHQKEIEDIGDSREKIQVKHLLHLHGKAPLFDSIMGRQRAETLISFGFGVGDAVHLALAEQTADYFITCDDKILSRSRKINISTEVLSPIEFCLKEDLQ
jgi:predicted nucleic acid-binding protein